MTTFLYQICHISYCKLCTPWHYPPLKCFLPAPEANMTQRDPFIKLKPPAPPLTVWAVWDRGHGGTTQSSKSAPYLHDVDRRRRNRWRVVKKNGLPQTHSSLQENLYLTRRNEAAIRTEESGFAEEMFRTVLMITVSDWVSRYSYRGFPNSSCW